MGQSARPCHLRPPGAETLAQGCSCARPSRAGWPQSPAAPARAPPPPPSAAQRLTCSLGEEGRDLAVGVFITRQVPRDLGCPAPARVRHGPIRTVGARSPVSPPAPRAPARLRVCARAVRLPGAARWVRAQRPLPRRVSGWVAGRLALVENHPRLWSWPRVRFGAESHRGPQLTAHLSVWGGETQAPTRAPSAPACVCSGLWPLTPDPVFCPQAADAPTVRPTPPGPRGEGSSE